MRIHDPTYSIGCCRPQLHRLRKVVSWVPLLGQLTTRGLELLEGVQQYYVYTSGS